jgi:hypothetical protein
VSTAGASGAESWRRPLAVVLAILGLLAIVAGILYLSGAANSLHFMVGKVHHGHHQIRAVVSLVIGVVLLVAAWFVAKGKTMTKRAAPQSRRAAPTAGNTGGAPTAETTSGAPTAETTSGAPAAENTNVAPTAENTNVAPTADDTDGAPTVDNTDGR